MADVTFSTLDLYACTYCKHLKDDSRNAAMFCRNRESSVYNAAEAKGEATQLGVDLLPKELVVGCEKIDYNGKKIPRSLANLIPTDSHLRTTLGIDDVVEAGDESLDTKFTSHDILKQMNVIWDDSLKLLKEQVKENRRRLGLE